MTEPAPDQIVAEKYRLTRVLGRGGMGSVWEGLHTTLGIRVAVKFIDKQYADSEEARTRFENEARAAAKLTSKHVVRVYDHGVTDDGSAYIVMEFLEGEPLDKRLDRLGRLSAADTATILAQVCRGLANAHQAGIVHRDLKPENIFLVWDPEDQADVAKVVDFGIAKFEESSGVSSSTRTGLVLGTPYYMSPEQARGFKNLDLRSDLWSIGVIAYRCIVGALPFNGEAMGDLLVKICVDPLPVPSKMAANVPPAFDAWFVRALAREPEDRFENAAQLAEGLLVACGVASPAQVYRSQLSSGAVSPAVSTPDAAFATPGPFGDGVAQDPRASTGAPLTQTARGSLRPRGLTKGALFAAVIGGAILTIAIFALAKLFGPPQGNESPGTAQHSPTPELPASTPSSAPSVEPTSDLIPSASAEPKVAPAASDATESSAPARKVPARTAPRREKKPAGTPSPRPKSPEDLLGY